MYHTENVNENFENVKENFEINIKMQQLKEELNKSFSNYKRTMQYMASDAPISVLCLPKKIEKILTDQGFLRIYDLINVDLVKIEGIPISRLSDITSRLDQFLSML